MIKVEVTKNFRISEYNKIYNIQRVDNKQPYNKLIVGDTFECEEEMCRHLLGEDDNNPVVKIIEVCYNKGDQDRTEPTF